MSRYRAVLELRSPLATPLRGDTIFGHLCWAIREHEGEPALADFLRRFDEETSPPVVFSDALPKGLLPRPQLPPRDAPGADSTLTEREYDEQKKRKKARFVDRDSLLGDGSVQAAGKRRVSAPPSSAYTTRGRMHNTINRATFTVNRDDEAGAAGLFAREEYWAPAPDQRRGGTEAATAYRDAACFDLYVESGEPEARLEELLRWTFEAGFGADRSTGYGQIDLLEHETGGLLAEESSIGSGGWAMALAPFVPGGNVPPKGLRATLFTRYGKLGGEYAQLGNPFKYPIVMYETGSAFPAEVRDRRFVGSLVHDVHRTRPEVRHHAYAPLIYVEDTDG